jgi:hypothetical protein
LALPLLFAYDMLFVQSLVIYLAHRAGINVTSFLAFISTTPGETSIVQSSDLKLTIKSAAMLAYIRLLALFVFSSGKCYYIYDIFYD